MGYEVLRGGGKEVSGEAIAKAQGHNGPSSTCTCETCTKHREQTHIYGPTPKPPVELPAAFTFKGASNLNADERQDLLYLLKTGARRYSVMSFPTIWDFTKQMHDQLQSGNPGPATNIDVSGYNERDRKFILKWLHEVHGKDTTAFGADSLQDLILEFERFVFPEGYEPEVYPDVKTLRQEYNANRQAKELR